MTTPSATAPATDAQHWRSELEKLTEYTQRLSDLLAVRMQELEELRAVRQNVLALVATSARNGDDACHFTLSELRLVLRA